MQHDFDTRENTGWVICKKCGYVLPPSGVVAEPVCKGFEYDSDEN